MNMRSARSAYRKQYSSRQEIDGKKVTVKIRMWKAGAPGFRAWARKNCKNNATGKLAQIVQGRS